MQGRRIYPSPQGQFAVGDEAFPTPGPGDYWRHSGGSWYARLPNGLYACLSGHKVTEHADGTITASPSILCDDGTSSWHGFLERGVWRGC